MHHKKLSVATMELKKKLQHLYNIDIDNFFLVKSIVRFKSGTNYIISVPKMTIGYCDDIFSQVSILYLATENFDMVA